MNQILTVKKALRLQEWQKRIDDFNSSGMKLHDWLYINGVTKDAYYYWLRKCRSASIENLPAEIKSQLPDIESKPRLAKVQVQYPVSNMQASVAIKLPYATVEIANGTDRQTLEAVLLALKAIC